MAYNTLKKIKFVIFVVILMTSFSVIATQQPAYAQEYKKYELLEPLPCIPDEVLDCNDSTTGKNSTLTSVNMAQFFQYGFNLFIAIAGVAAVFMMVWGGFLYITSDSWFKKDQGKTYFQNAIYGLLMILCSYLILRTVNPKLVSFPRTIPVITSTTVTENPVSFFDQLNQAATNYHADARKFLEEGRQADITLTSLEKERKGVEDELFKAELSNAGLESQTMLVSDLSVKLAKIDDQIKEKKAIIVASAAKTTMTNAGLSMTVSSIGSLATDANAIALEVSDSLDFIEQQRQDATNRLNQMRAYDQITKPGGVDDNAQAAKLTLQIQGLDVITNKAVIQEGFWNTLTGGWVSNKVSVVVGSQDMGTVDQFSVSQSSKLETLSKQISTVKDPKLQEELQKLVTNAKTTINTKFKK